LRLAIEEANAAGNGPHINLKTYDDKGTDDGGKDVARQIVAGPAVLILGPAFSHMSLQARPIQCGGRYCLARHHRYRRLDHSEPHDIPRPLQEQ
jgi:ABC-type branched-subunit amino acid transport system substrate-binding protein